MRSVEKLMRSVAKLMRSVAKLMRLVCKTYEVGCKTYEVGFKTYEVVAPKKLWGWFEKHEVGRRTDQRRSVSTGCVSMHMVHSWIRLRSR